MFSYLLIMHEYVIMPNMFLTCFSGRWSVHLVFFFLFIWPQTSEQTCSLTNSTPRWVMGCCFRLLDFFAFLFGFEAKHIYIMAIRRVKLVITIDNLDYTIRDVAFDESFVLNYYKKQLQLRKFMGMEQNP